ncbi:MAG: phosphoribosylaminoimidazolesuccinocarboxamide synthase [Planctomycetales bacterium]|nr:phosphoribosylaminoimidazolesuccinocarboxamide synthase [Planctomycetales bacterium]
MPVTETHLASWPCRRGKVRDVYDLGETLLLVSTDRISAFDWILPTPIPDKGRVLTTVSNWWFGHLGVANHLLESDVARMPLGPDVDRGPLAGRSVLVKKAAVVPIECVVRGYLAGSGWKEYQTSGEVCGVKLPPGLVESDRLPEPIFTPATKAEQGEHDENITFDRMCEIVGGPLAEELRTRAVDIYRRGAAHAESVGILLADTKFEFGLLPGAAGEDAATRASGDPVDLARLILIDEAMTPDSSRFWPADAYQPGRGQPSFDKQFVRDWLSTCGWDKNSPPPELPADIVAGTRAKYVEACEKITGAKFA